MTDQTSPSSPRIQRILAYIVAALIVISLVCIALILIGSAAGWLPRSAAAASASLWPTIWLLPLIALPIGFVLIIILLIVSARSRRATAQSSVAATKQTSKR